VDVGIDIGDVGYGMDMLYQYNQDEYWMDWVDVMHRTMQKSIPASESITM
jgi:hypothetical protein